MDINQFDDESLMRLIVHRQENALSELYDRYGRLVYSISVNVLGEAGAAEEVTQDVFLRVWERAVTYDAEQGKVVTWLARITRNRAIDLVRFRHLRLESSSIAWEELSSTPPVDGHNVEQTIELAQQQQRIRQAIGHLPPEQREALALAYFQGLTHQEIADRLGQPLGTVKTRVRLAMQKLKSELVE